MCSERRDEVAAVKSELFKAGIRSEIRENPLTAALRIKRLELWVEHERDYLPARQIYSRIQAGGGNGQDPVVTVDAVETSIDVEELPAPAAGARGRGAGPDAKTGSKQPAGELAEASSLLEKEIEEVIKREDALADTCAALRTEIEKMNRSFAESQAAAEKKTAEFATLQSSLEGALAARTRSEEQLQGQVRELQAQLKAGQETLSEAQKKLDVTLQDIQAQQTLVTQLRKQVAAREQESDANHRLASQAQAELAAERDSRRAAEAKAATLAQAQERLEEQLEKQKDLEAQLRASLGSINSLRGRLQAKRISSQG